MLIIISITFCMSGNNTKIEPRVNPIIENIVCLLYLSSNILIIFINIKLPTNTPIAIGINTGKYKFDIDVKYSEYIPKSINIIVLLTPGTTIPIDIKNPLNIKYK